MKHRLLSRITQSAAFYYRDQPLKFPGSFPLRRIFTGLLGAVALAGLAAAFTASAAESTIPIIVKDTTSGFWQIVLAGARKAGKDLGVKVPELGAQSEADINGQVSILENAVSEKPAAIVIAPTQFRALGKPNR
jgi:ribose transport system substrate-binding protein